MLKRWFLKDILLNHCILFYYFQVDVVNLFVDRMAVFFFKVGAFYHLNQ